METRCSVETSLLSYLKLYEDRGQSLVGNCQFHCIILCFNMISRTGSHWNRMHFRWPSSGIFMINEDHDLSCAGNFVTKERGLCYTICLMAMCPEVIVSMATDVVQRHLFSCTCSFYENFDYLQVSFQDRTGRSLKEYFSIVFFRHWFLWKWPGCRP